MEAGASPDRARAVELDTPLYWAGWRRELGPPPAMGRRRGAPSGYAREVDEGGGPAREGGVCWVGHPALLGRVEKRVESPHPQWAGGAVHPAAISGVLM